MQILVAEDDLTSRVMLAGALEKGGHSVVAAANGSDAWRILQEPDAPPLAILDWMMPVMDGLEVVRRVRERTANLQPYLIILTARGDKTDIVAGLAAGADDYLVKPYDIGELHARVAVGRRLLEAHATLAKKVEELQQALDHVKTLRGIVPICACCKKVRDDQGYWDQVESYISRHSEARFSHGLCPGCTQKLYPEFAPQIAANSRASS